MILSSCHPSGITEFQGESWQSSTILLQIIIFHQANMATHYPNLIASPDFAGLRAHDEAG
jgi:hypothetical protein